MKKTLIIIIVILITIFNINSSDKKNKILMIISCKNFEDSEYKIPKKIFEDNNYEVITASSQKFALGREGTRVRNNILIKDIDVTEYDAIVFVGGVGAKEFINNKIAHKIAVDVYKSGIIISAICISPRILYKAGILKGKKATCYDPYGFENAGVIYTGNLVERDENIITGRNPEAADDFAELILKTLSE